MLPSPIVMAIDTLGTTPTEFPLVSPLLVTSYRTTTTGTDFDFIEVFNTSNSLVNLRDWKIIDVANNRTLQLSSRNDLDYVTPGTHVVIGASDVVGNATYMMNGWQSSDATPITISLLTALRFSKEGYRTTDISLNTTGTAQVRTYNTSSYSTAANPFTSGLSRSLFDDGAYVVPVQPAGLGISEFYSYSSDCAPFDESVLCGDYIELHNASDMDIDLSDLVLRTDSNSSSRATSNTFTLSGLLAPDAYFAVTQTDEGGRISLTNSGGYVWLEDTWGLTSFVDTVVQWPSATTDQQGFAYAHDAAAGWRWTTTPTPDAQNTITEPVQVIAECPAGKYRSPESGRCRTIEEAVSELATCEEGYERNLTTNRCRKVSLAVASTFTPCLEGQERNPVTNRCRSIASAVAELMPCDEGYERNPATNRCRKLQSLSVPSAPFAVEPTVASVPLWQWWAGGAILAALAGYGVWEWRHEIRHFWRRLTKR